MRIDASIGAVGDLYTRLHGPAEALSLQSADLALLFEHLLREPHALVGRQDVVVVVDVGHKVGAVLEHQADAFFIKQAAVLDGVHAGAHGPFDPLGAMSVRCHTAAPHVGFVDQRLHLLQRILRCAHRPLFRQNPGGGDHLDHICSVLDVEPHLLADLIDAVGDAGEVVELQIRGEPGYVGVAAGRADGQTGHLQSRANDLAGIDGLAQGDVDEFDGADVAAGGETGHQGAAGVDMGRDGDVDGRLAEQPLVVVARLRGDVCVGVDQAGQDSGVTQVEDGGALRHGDVGFDRLDAVPLDQDVLVRSDLASHHVHKATGADNSHFRGILLGQTGRSKHGN